MIGSAKKPTEAANADFSLMTKFANGNDVEIPGRIVGFVSDDIYFDNDKQSIWYGEARPIANIPIGIRDYAGRLLTTLKTDLQGGYEALLPSTETLNCPIPQGPCPGMYLVVVNDPGVGRGGEKTEERPADDVVAEIVKAGGKAAANYDSVSDYLKAGLMAIRLAGGQICLRRFLGSIGEHDIRRNRNRLSRSGPLRAVHAATDATRTDGGRCSRSPR